MVWGPTDLGYGCGIRIGRGQQPQEFAAAI
jgi:hypothetical protein